MMTAVSSMNATNTNNNNIIIIFILLLLLIGTVVVDVSSAFQQQQQQQHHHHQLFHQSNNSPFNNKRSCYHHQQITTTRTQKLFAFTTNTGGGTTANNFISIDENTPRDIQSMEQWAISNGVQRSDGFQLNCDDGGLYYDVYAMTTQDVPANTPVLFVPNTMILSANQIQQEFGTSSLLREAEKLLKSLNAYDGNIKHFYLILKILMEYELGDQSPYYYWLNSLPRYYSNGPSMTDLCFECLPPLARSLAMKERTNLLNLSNLNKVPFLTEQTKNNPDLIKWAYQIVYTRSYEVNNGDDLQIIPMADIFNHCSDQPEVILEYDVDGNCYGQTTRDVPAGSQLRISYGNYGTNPSFLLARYGFVDESSPGSFCKLMIPHVDSKLVDIGYDPTKMLFYKDTGEVSQEVWDVLLYQILSSSNARRRREFYDAHMNNDVTAKQSFHDVYWPETSTKLLQHIDTFLGELDDLLLKSYGREDFNEHPRLPLILKHNEFVKNTFLMVRQRYFSS